MDRVTLTKLHRDLTFSNKIEPTKHLLTPWYQYDGTFTILNHSTTQLISPRLSKRKVNIGRASEQDNPYECADRCNRIIRCPFNEERFAGNFNLAVDMNLLHPHVPRQGQLP